MSFDVPGVPLAADVSRRFTAPTLAGARLNAHHDGVEPDKDRIRQGVAGGDGCVEEILEDLFLLGNNILVTPFTQTDTVPDLERDLWVGRLLADMVGVEAFPLMGAAQLTTVRVTAVDPLLPIPIFGVAGGVRDVTRPPPAAVPLVEVLPLAPSPLCSSVWPSHADANGTRGNFSDLMASRFLPDHFFNCACLLTTRIDDPLFSATTLPVFSSPSISTSFIRSAVTATTLIAML